MLNYSGFFKITMKNISHNYKDNQKEKSVYFLVSTLEKLIYLFFTEPKHAKPMQNISFFLKICYNNIEEVLC